MLKIDLLHNIEIMIEGKRVFPDMTRPHVSEAQMKEENRVTRLVCKSLIDRHGIELFPDARLYMNSPIRQSPVYKSRVETQTYRYKVEYRPFAPGFERDGATEDEILEWLCSEMRDELWDEIERLAYAGQVMYPYLPVMAVGKIDPQTMYPYMVFTSRFGVGLP